ncbi:MAG TPA: ribulose-phosphate 3-epimerase, partial [Blastocatellia bacterium]|nr:ribulose-phosphate 3-epimerase [Blastocatellia bacterium]
DRYIGEIAKAGANLISVHVEAVAHIHRTITAIRELGCRPGLALNPGSPVVAAEELLPFVDYVLVMSVNPGFGGQSFITTQLDKIRRLRAMIESRGLDVRLEVDGGVVRDNIKNVVRSGGEWLVAGSAVFGKSDPEEATRTLRQEALEAISI